MADPFDALRLPLRPTAPDPAFAERLRRRVQQALYLPRGVTVSNLTSPSDRPNPTAAATQGVMPYLIVADGRRAIA